MTDSGSRKYDIGLEKNPANYEPLSPLTDDTP